MKNAAFFTFNVLLLLVFLTGCKVEPQAIPYGQANCAHCQMTVADNRYGAELVNDKGKPFFFDSAECLAAYVLGQPDQGRQAAFLMVTDYTRPGELVDVRTAHFLQSEELPSPMGMNLTAVADEATARKMQQQYSGKLLTWDQVLVAVKNNDKF